MRRWILCLAILVATLLPCSAAHAGTLGTDVIGMFPKNVGEFAYADLRQARSLSWFPQLEQQMLPARFRQFEQFLSAAGVDPNSQVEELAWALVPTGLPTGQAAKTAVPTGDQVVGVALGSFDPEESEAYFRAQKLPVVKVRSYSLFAFGSGVGPNDLFFLFIDANTAAFGQRKELEQLIAVRYGEQQGLLNNPEMSSLINEANGTGVVWAVLNAPYTRLAMRQLAPETAQFPQAEQLASKLRALTIEIQVHSGVQAQFQAVCDSPDDANTFAALMQAGLLYRRYQIGDSNPDLAAMLDQARIVPSGDRLNIRLTLTDDQVIALIRHNTFALHM